MKRRETKSALVFLCEKGHYWMQPFIASSRVARRGEPQPGDVCATCFIEFKPGLKSRVPAQQPEGAR